MNDVTITGFSYGALAQTVNYFAPFLHSWLDFGIGMLAGMGVAVGFLLVVRK